MREHCVRVLYIMLSVTWIASYFTRGERSPALMTMNSTLFSKYNFPKCFVHPSAKRHSPATAARRYR